MSLKTKPGPDQPHQEPGEVHLAGLPGRLVRTLVQLVGYEMCSAMIPSRLRGVETGYASFLSFLKEFWFASFLCL